MVGLRGIHAREEHHQKAYRDRSAADGANRRRADTRGEMEEVEEDFESIGPE